MELQNPILNAFIQGQGERRKREQQEFENEQAKENQKLKQDESKRQEQQLQGYLKNLDAQHKHQVAQHELEVQKLQLERNAHEMNARKQLAQGLANGTERALTPGEQNSSPAGGIVIGDPANGGFVFDPRQFSNPQQQLSQEVTRAKALGTVHAQAAGEQAGAVAAAEDPFKRAAEVTKMQFEREQALNKTIETTKNLTQTIEGHKAVARINGNYELDKARISQMGGINTPEEWTTTVTPYILGDAQKPIGNTPKDRLLRNHITAMGMKEVTSKETEKLDNLHSLDPLTSLMDEFIAAAPKSKVGAAGELVLGKIPTTDLNNLKNRIRSMGGTVASTLDAQKGRMANQEIERVLAGLATPGQTVANAHRDVDLIKQRVSSIAIDNFLGGISDKQKLLILQNRKFDPASFVTKAKDGTTVERYKKNARGEWLVFSPEKDGWEPIDAK